MREEKIIYANDYAKNDGLMRVHFIAHADFDGKSDGFLIECGKYFLLIDGGVEKSTAVHRYLRAKREALLSEHPELVEDKNCKLRLSFLISHFHSDHMNALIEQILKDPYIEAADFYLPPDFDIAPKYILVGKDADAVYRPRLWKALLALEEPKFTLHHIELGKEHRAHFSREDGFGRRIDFAIYPPTENLGREDYLALLADRYFDGDHTASGLMSAAINNSSIWLSCRFAGLHFLFTGDTMKRLSDMENEGLDLMMAAYRDEIGKVDVLKFPHHGYVRETAIPAMISLSPSYTVVTKRDSNIRELVTEQYGEEEGKKVLNSADETLIFTCGYEEKRGEELLTLEVLPPEQ